MSASLVLAVVLLCALLVLISVISALFTCLVAGTIVYRWWRMQTELTEGVPAKIYETINRKLEPLMEVRDLQGDVVTRRPASQQSTTDEDYLAWMGRG